LVDYELVTDELSITFGALADPTRRAILERLATGEATVNELAEPFDISLQAISRHIKVLERAGLISRGRDAQFRPCRLEDAQLDGALDWIAQHRSVWEDRMDQLEMHLRTIQQRNRPARPTAPTHDTARPHEETAPKPSSAPTRRSTR
jgi:DNA-binding transcriptional ArsR family regulator